MAVSKSASLRPYTKDNFVELEVEPVEQVSNFVYLGATISRDGTIDRDLVERLRAELDSCCPGT